MITCVRVGSESGRKERKSWKLVSAPPLAKLSPNRIKILTLGHKGLYDDFATIWAIQFMIRKNRLVGSVPGFSDAKRTMRPA